MVLIDKVSAGTRRWWLVGVILLLAVTGTLAAGAMVTVHGAPSVEAAARAGASVPGLWAFPDLNEPVRPVRRAGGGGPLILGHRGGTERGYQNTMAAFNDAISLHLDYIETDVRHTADGVAVLMHDPRLPGACTRYPGVAVRALTAAQLATVRCAGQPVPRLSELVARLRRPDAAHVGLMAEVKDVDPLGIRDLVAPLGGNRVIIESFQWQALAAIEATSPRAATCPLGVTAATLSRALAVTHDCIGPDWSAAGPGLVGAAHLAGAGVLVWTVDDPAMMRRLAAEGVDGIITDDARVALRVLRAPTANARPPVGPGTF